MKNNKKIILTFFITALLLACMCVFTASAENEGPYVYEINEGEVTIVRCDPSVEGDIIIPQTLGGIPVTAIGEKAFYYCSGITSVLIDDNITSIGKAAFAFCGALSEVVLPDTIEEIPDETFYMCFNLTNASLSKTNIKRIGARAFAYCEFLSIVNLPDTLETVGEEAFHWCNSLEKVVIGKSVKEIGLSAFSKCYAIRDVYCTGTLENFDNIAIAEGNNKITEAFFYFEHQHNYVKGKQINKGDCVTRGKTVYTCSLCSDTYYNVYYGSHSYKNVTTKATFKADGKIESKCTICSNIKKTTVIPKAVAKFSKTAYAYTGKTITPTVTVKDSAGTALEKDKTYTVKLSSGRKELGEYYATVKLAGDKYSGSTKIYFNIIPGKPTVTVEENVDSIKLTWSKVNGANGYRVYSYNPETKKYTTLKTLTGTTYTIKNLTSGTDYVYTVRSYGNLNGEKVWGNHSFVYTATVPATVKISSATVKDANKAVLKWQSTPATGYEIYMATGKNGEYKKIKTITKNTTVTYTKSSLAKGTYSFIMRAYKTVDGTKLYGDFSKVKSVSIK